MSDSIELKALTDLGFMAFWENEKPKCPHCSADFEIQDQEAWHLYNDEDEHQVECSSCELEFKVKTSVSYSFSTDEQDED